MQGLYVCELDFFKDGAMAEWLCRGLQILVCRFDSGSCLHFSKTKQSDFHFLWCFWHFCLEIKKKVCYTVQALNAKDDVHRSLFLGSSVVEQLTVNQLVGGSNPSRGATFIFSYLHTHQ